MAAIMGVQRTATARNQRAEQVSQYLFTEFSTLVGGKPPVPQARFSSEIAQDIWDTKFVIGDGNEKLEIWSQTTCYKGHANPRRREPNKVYEFRETIAELVSLLASHPSPSCVRTVHVTYGNYRYSYPWIHNFKRFVFDSSIIVNLVDANIHEAIEESIGTVLVESQIFKKLDDERAEGTPLGVALDEALKQLTAWYLDELKPSRMGRELAQISAANIANIDLQTSLSELPVSIKGQVVQILLGAAHEPIDPVLSEAADEFLEVKPFLRAARLYLDDWKRFGADINGLPDGPLSDFIYAGWQSPNHNLRAVFRRLAARAGFIGDVNYVQDIDVDGITEHNLYGGDHSESQVHQIVDIFVPRLEGIQIVLGSEFAASMITSGRAVLDALYEHEVKNGTNANHAKSVIHKQVRDWGYAVAESPVSAGYPAAGFHIEAHSDLVNDEMVAGPKQFNNFSLVLSEDGSPLAYLKAKYFRQQEFERRAKEEGFVGLALTAKWENGSAQRAENSIPVIMYVDTDDNPSSDKVRRSLSKLQAFGWLTCLSLDDLKFTLEGLKEARAL